MNYFDSLFMLNTPAGWVEYRKKMPFSSGFHWDRCDYLNHGEKIPKNIPKNAVKEKPNFS